MSDPLPSGMGLYADLLAGPAAKSSDTSTISSAPVKYNLKPQVSASPVPKKKDAALQFQPMVKRPQQKGKKSGAAQAWAANTTTVATTTPADITKPITEGSKIEYWLEKGNDHKYVRPKPKWYKDRKNKRKQQHEEVREHNWDDIYDPMEPNNYRAYKGSEEQYRDISEWKDRLYFRANGIKPQKEEEPAVVQPMNRMFAPPSLYDSVSTNAQPATFPEDATGEDAFARRARLTAASIPPPPPYPDHPQESLPHVSPPSQQPPLQQAPQQQPSADVAAKQAEVLAKLAAVKAKIMASKPTSHPSGVESALPPPPPSSHAGLGSFVPPQSLSQAHQPIPDVSPHHAGFGSVGEPQSLEAPSFHAGLGSAALSEPIQHTMIDQPPTLNHNDAAGTISRAPVRYAVPEQMQAPSQPDEQQDISNEARPRPKKEGFGKRMLEKQGWKEGHGLGANSEGITTAIYAQAQKRKKLAGADGGGLGPRNMGKIVGGKRRKVDSDESEPGMSNVIKLPGMLKGLDVKHEIEEKNLQQELGEWFDKNYGKVERVVIWREEQGGDDEVFIKFTNPISALKAVNPNDALTFANNEVNASFFDSSKFDRGEYA